MTYRLTALLLLLATLTSSVTLASQAAPRTDQSTGDEKSELVADLQQATGGAARISYHAQTGQARFIGSTPDRPIPPNTVGAAAITTPEQAARNFVQNYGALFGVGDQQRELRAARTTRVDRRRAFVRFQQTYNGVPVLGGEVNVQTTASGATISANGEILPDLRVNTTPAIDAQTAQQTAIAALAQTYALPASSFRATAPELWIYNPVLLGGPGLQRAVLVWRMEVTAGAPDPIRELVLIDAHRGVVALHFNQIAAARERYVCDRNNARTSTDACTVATAVRKETGAASSVAEVELAFEYSGATYDFFAERFGRDSLDDQGYKLFSTVRYCAASGPCPYDNAYWNGVQMVYGDGFASADDVVAHELTHGFTQFTSGLFYYYQSGAINESLSDVFGELIDQAYNSANDNDEPQARWLIGEDMPLSIGVIRNMAQPEQFGHPDSMNSGLYHGSETDAGGVHLNSGVNNKAAYLLADGGSFNNVTITGLGVEKVAQIYYEAAAYLLLSASDYADLADALQQACTNLSGAHGVTPDDCRQVQNVVAATEMYQTPQKAPATDAPVCDSGQPSNLFYDELENPASGNWRATALIGENGWYYPQNSHNYKDIDSTYATSGRYNLWGDNPGEQSDSAIAMTFDRTLPPNAYFHFKHAYGFDDFISSNQTQTFYDGGVLEYSINNGATWQDAGHLFTHNGYNGTITTTEDNPLAGREGFVGQSNGYRSSRLDLSSLAGKRVRFRFRIGTDSKYADYGWYIDDIRLYTCTTNGFMPRNFMPLVQTN